jgi:hypothetical protein
MIEQQYMLNNTNLILQPSADKFNVIKNHNFMHSNYIEILKNYLENFLESEINIYHPEYIYQIIHSEILSYNQIIDKYMEVIKHYITNVVDTFIKKIKSSKFSIKSLNTFLLKFNNKNNIMCDILLISKNISNLSITNLITNPVIISFLESNILQISDYKDINSLICYIKNISDYHYTWILKLIGSVYRDNLNIIDIITPEKFKLLYEFNYIVDYCNNISNLYNFLKSDIYILLESIYKILQDKIINYIKLSNISEIIKFIDNKYNIYNKIINDKNSKKEIINNINDKILKIKEYNYESVSNILNIIIKCQNMKILESYILLLFHNDTFCNIILEIIHNEINTNINFINSICSLFIFIKNKDIFYNSYHKLLIQRLLSQQTNVNNEKTIFCKLENYCNPKLLFKINNVIQDYNISKNFNFDYETYFLNIKNDIIKETQNISSNETYNKNINVLITSYSNWDINYNQGYVKIYNNILDDYKFTLHNYILNYQNYYLVKSNNKRNILWLLQYGTVDITYNSINIVLLPIQLLVLELFNYKDSILFDGIINQSFFSNYSLKFKNDIIQSLILGNILINKNNILTLSSAKNISNNFIELFINNSIVVNPFINMEIEIAHTREDIIKSLIFNIVKIEPKNIDELFILLTNKIFQFKVEIEIVNKVIDNMIKLDYIILNDNKYLKKID